MRARRRLLAVLALTCLAAPLAAQTPDCFIGGVIDARPNLDAPYLGAWEYTLQVDWSTGEHRLNRVDLLVDGEDGCACGELDAALDWSAVCGTFHVPGDDPPVDAAAELRCDGDPALGLDVPLLQFDHTLDAGGGPSGEGTLRAVFYSDYPPAPIHAPNLFLVDKFGPDWCAGEVTGVFPGLPCDPLADETASWGAVKARY